MSSLVLVNRAEEVSGTLDQRARAALRRPHAALSESRRADSEVRDRRAALLLHAVRRRSAVQRASAQLLRNGQAIAEAPLELAAATEGRVQQVGRLPVGGVACRDLRAAHQGDAGGARDISQRVLYARRLRLGPEDTVP